CLFSQPALKSDRLLVMPYLAHLEKKYSKKCSCTLMYTALFYSVYFLNLRSNPTVCGQYRIGFVLE
ncbi:hypothetical protein, partial [Legionella pneumophila]|uniref:hypothetical protein n=1 Tax=Legionella pneumophila TaxID=446 RepID=UPI001C4E0596